MKEIFKLRHDNYNTSFFKDCSDIREYDLGIVSPGLHSKFLNFSEGENVYVENYGNPLAELTHEYILLSVTSDENKVSLKLYRGKRYRKVFTTYFRVSTSCEYVTVSKKTGDVYKGKIIDYHKKKKVKKIFYKNDFSNTAFLPIYANLTSFLSHDKNIIDIQQKFHQAVSNFFSELKTPWSDILEIPTEDLLLKHYLDSKKIKYPNNYKIFFRDTDYKIKLKEIIKFDKKLVDAYMNKFHLNGKKIKKALHNSERLNIAFFEKVSSIFDVNWVNQDYELILLCLNSKIFVTSIFSDYYPKVVSEFTKIEKRRVFSFFKDYVLKLRVCDFNTFMDHLRMIKELKKLGETDISWKSKNIHEFNEEHQILTSKIEYHKKGYYNRIYEEKLLEMIERPIVIEENLYYPILIKNTDEYIRESCVQSNCVKTYIGNPSSYIVSLRKDTINSEERATIEFYLTKEGRDVPYFRIKQALGKFNLPLDKSWESPIETLMIRFANSFKNKKIQPVKIEKIFQDGRKLISDTYWDERGYLKWSSVDLTHYL